MEQKLELLLQILSEEQKDILSIAFEEIQSISSSNENYDLIGVWLSVINPS